MMDIVERLRDAENQEFIQDRQIFQLTVCSEAEDEIERLREALKDMDSYVSRADRYYLKPKTLAALKEKE